MKVWYEKQKPLSKQQIILNSQMDLAIFAILSAVGVLCGMMNLIALEIACFFAAILYWDLFHRSKDSFFKRR